MAPRLALMASRATREESLHLVLAAAGAVVGLVAGLVVLRGTSPLAGSGSIGQVAALSVFGCSASAGALVLAVVTPRSMPWFGGTHRWRRALDIVGLALVYGLLGLFLTSALFGVFQQAFQGVALDRMAGTFWVVVASAAGAYTTSAAASALTGRSLATLLAVFLTAGVLASAMNATDRYWWERYFSELGEGGDLASVTFNLTLLVTGVALLTVTEFLAHDLDRWAASAGEPAWVTAVVRTLLSAVGVLVALVALVSRDVSVTWHDVIAQTLVVVFGVLLVVTPVLLRRMPGGLLPVTITAFALLVSIIVMFVEVRYLNMTAFEMGAAAIVYVWLLLFIRIVSAAADGAEEGRGADAQSQPPTNGDDAPSAPDGSMGP
ncbi:hypothetical protein [Brachybacterium squillarum]|uniref:hypothetical protein n=1 Tax=Brachybacterium squillarum TaxID=661979 RepID=UPI002222A5F3|nr:hypothetical protein [Brachybacterium squillarum]MCW1803732.1 hypothetical protein [Brachybacterium squillarum]